MRAPLVECNRRLSNILRLTRGLDAVVERQLDDLADQGLIGKASTAVQLTKRSTMEVQELAFYGLEA